MQYKHRDISTVGVHGESVGFIADNPRLEDRVDSLSNEEYLISSLIGSLQENDVVWDIGACLGIHSFLTAAHLTNGNVYAFEPMPANRGVLVDNMTVNEFKNVEVRREALSNEDGIGEFGIREDLTAGYGRHSLTTGEYESIRKITVDTVRGDTLVNSGTVPQPNIVKIDVEGAEPLVLEGLKQTLSQDDCRHVFLETHEPNPVQPSYKDYGYDKEDLVSLLEDCGFTVREMKNYFHLHGRKTTDTENTTDTGSAIDVKIVVDDIAEREADAIVSSAGTSLRMGTGVAGSLREAGSDQLHYAALENSPAMLGDAVSHPAYGLNADILIHAVSMPHYGRGKSTTATIRKSVSNALTRAEDEGCRRVALPAVGCGLGGVSISTGAQIILDTISQHEGNAIEQVEFVAYTEDEADAMRLAAQKY